MEAGTKARIIKSVGLDDHDLYTTLHFFDEGIIVTATGYQSVAGNFEFEGANRDKPQDVFPQWLSADSYEVIQ